jgi:uncharacterized membrane protein
MIPLVVMLFAWVAFRLLGASGLINSAGTAAGALRYALAMMFTLTSSAHFLPTTRPDLIGMVPPGMPSPEALVSLTGLLELAGAAGLLLPATTTVAAYCLMALLIVMFPANVHAARAGLELAGQAATPLVWRLPLQLFWIGALWWVAQHHRRQRGPASAPASA